MVVLLTASKTSNPKAGFVVASQVKDVKPEQPAKAASPILET